MLQFAVMSRSDVEHHCVVPEAIDLTCIASSREGRNQSFTQNIKIFKRKLLSKHWCSYGIVAASGEMIRVWMLPITTCAWISELTAPFLEACESYLLDSYHSALTNRSCHACRWVSTEPAYPWPKDRGRNRCVINVLDECLQRLYAWRRRPLAVCGHIIGHARLAVTRVGSTAGHYRLSLGEKWVLW